MSMLHQDFALLSHHILNALVFVSVPTGDMNFTLSLKQLNVSEHIEIRSPKYYLTNGGGRGDDFKTS